MSSITMDRPIARTRITAPRVTMVISNLGWGGAQKVMVTMANYWAARGWQVTLIALDVHPSYFQLAPAVTLVMLDLSEESGNVMGGLARNIGRIATLRRALRASRPDIVISFLSSANVLTLLASRGLGVPVIVSERSDPRRNDLPRIWRMLRHLAYPLAVRLVAQTDAALAYFPPRIRRRGVVVPNPVELPDELPGDGQRAVVGVGHLVHLKGFDLLITAFARCAARHPDWQLIVWGLGPDADELLALADRLGIKDRVRLAGRSATPGAWIETVGIFVLASRHEGFPNVLVEAMAAGRPVIATDCPAGGPRAMIRDNVDGLLVPNGDVEALAMALDRLMADPDLRTRFGRAARQRAERFALPRIMSQWEALIADAIAAQDRDRPGLRPLRAEQTTP